VPNKKTKRIISFRLDPQIIDNLYKAAKEDKITLNALVDQILDSYVYWDRRSTKAGWILIKDDAVKLFINSLSEKTLEKLGKRVARIAMRDTLLSIYGKVDLASLLLTTKYRSIKSNFTYQEFHYADKINLVITHGMGPKWSFFHKVFYMQMLKDLGRKASVSTTANTLIVDIKSK
jgi:hypothetical protein